MHRLTRIIHEIHRRSLWQVLAIYLVGSAGAIQAIQAVTDSAGLPDWVPPGAFVLLILGLPIVLATAFVQEGVGGIAALASEETSRPTSKVTEEPPHNRVFTWRNAVVGGVVAFAVLGVSVGVYTFMWAKGVGPVGNLVAQGVLDERERIVLADFRNSTSDSLLGDIVTEALRVDLTTSQAITVAEPAWVSQVLQRMGRSPQETFSPELAREAAVREGLKAVIEGDVGAVGTGFVLTARIVAAADGSSLAAFRETARDANGILDAIDALSQAIRSKVGESLTTIRETGALEQVTTASLEALRLYSQAMEVSDQGDARRAITLLEEALAQDSDFAMAWRKLGTLLNNTGAPEERRAEAARRAYELRERLTPKERGLATAWYYWSPGPEQSFERAGQVYESVLESYPDDPAALNNLSNIRNGEGDFAGAAELLQRAVSGAGESSTAHLNLVRALFRLGREEDARAAHAVFAERYPTHPEMENQRFMLAFFGRQWEEADSIARGILARDRERAADSYYYLGMIRVAQGHLAEAQPYFGQRADVSAVEGYETAFDQAYIEYTWLDAAAARRTVATALAHYPLEAMPAEERPFEGIARVYAEVGDERETQRFLSRWETERPGAAQGTVYQGERAGVLGSLALARGDFTLAEQHFRDARRFLGCTLCYRIELGETMLRLGKAEEALIELESRANDRQLSFGDVIVHTVAAPVVYELIGETQGSLGRRAEAAAAYDQVVELWKDADPVLQPRIERARQKAAALRGSE